MAAARPSSRSSDAHLGLLDDPVWHALTGPHRRFALTPDRGDGPARAYRYRVDVAPFATLLDVTDPDAWRDLAGLSGPGDRAVLVAPSGQPAGTVSSGWSVAQVLPCQQMIAPVDGLAEAPTRAGETLVTLGPRDAAEMVALAELTRPGPFAASTVELGGYIGVRRDGRLVAMAGHRLQLPGWIEISAVCAHPAHRGQGLARLLIAAVDAAIRQQGHRAFLHAIHQNVTAIGLYRQLGFTTRADMTFTVVQFSGT
ncbi:MAG: GNAT family N-acetyltransferase [Mycobacterium sp.]